MKEEIEEAL